MVTWGQCVGGMNYEETYIRKLLGVMELHTLNVCNLLYINDTSIELIFEKLIEAFLAHRIWQINGRLKNSYFIFWYFGFFSHKRNICIMHVANDDTENNAQGCFNKCNYINCFDFAKLCSLHRGHEKNTY